MRSILFVLSFLMVATAAQSQMKIESNGNGVFFESASTANSLTLGKNRAGNGNIIVDLNASASDEVAGYGFRFLRTATGSSRFNHAGTGQYQFLADDNANIAFFINGTQTALFRHTSGDFELKVGDAYKLGGGPWSALSDKRLKTNVKEYSDGLKELMKINPVSYQYTSEIDPQSKEYIGVIAQDLQQVVPYMTQEFDLIDAQDKSKGTYLSVDPNAFTYMLINAVKEQQVMIDQRDQEMDALKDQVQDLSAKLDALTELLVQETHDASEANVVLEGTGARLEQNQPNPFDEFTRIEYSVPANVASAAIRIVDSNGKVIKLVNVVGDGFLNVETKDLPSGNYHYSLIVDGELVDTKTMIFSK